MAIWFITGASRGLGAEIARTASAAGDDVVAVVRDPGRLPEDLAAAPNVLPVALDVTDSAAIPGAVQAAVERFGRIDVLVNNAGRGLLGALEEVTEAEARALFDLNVFGLINMTRAVLPVMREQGGGKLVHIGSRSGFEGKAGVSMYAATKFAVAGISEALAMELAPFGIQSMVVEPGMLRTDFFDDTSVSRVGNRIAAYDETPAHAVLDGARFVNHNQPGDPVRSAALIHEVTSGEKLPLHLYVGADAVESIQAKVRQIHDDLTPWREKSAAVAYDDVA
jgi:NAD(P)-dependent dehydrogenase (short-subunit alcohol dehydrogenase family)